MVSPRLSKRLIASYISDWVVLVIIAVIAFIFDRLHPHYHAFSLLDLSISYPLVSDTVPFWVAIVAAGAVPAVLIPIVILAFVPSRSIRRASTRSRVLQLKLWEWHAAWLGLAMSLVLATMVTTGLKKFGKPRPNALARCQPDLNAIASNAVGGDGQDISARWTLVTIAICKETSAAILDDGFQSWPSGHSSFSWSGLLYLSLFLAAKFSIKLPSLPLPSSSFAATHPSSRPETTNSVTESRPMLQSPNPAGVSEELPIPNRDEAAAPPLYLLFALLVPIGGAFYIALSRWMDYAHHGFDVLSGSLIGIVSAYFSFRWYHPPLARGSGWAWGPRSPERAFEIGVGVDRYVEERTKEMYANGQDIELGRIREE